MQELIALQGLVATTPRTVTTKDGFPLTSFRLVSAARRFNREIAQWEDSNTNWYTVVGFRRIAENMSASLEKGQRVILQGRLRVKETAKKREQQLRWRSLESGTTSAGEPVFLKEPFIKQPIPRS